MAIDNRLATEIEALREWFDTATHGYWETVDNIEAELGRKDSPDGSGQGKGARTDESAPPRNETARGGSESTGGVGDV